MCGGGGNKAGDEANRLERERQARIASTIASVNQVFDNPGRQGEIADYGNAMRQFYSEDLNRQKAETDRELRFALARGGLVGGSAQVDQQRRFGEQYARGLLDVERRSAGAMADLTAADQDARARFIGLANQGLDATTGASQAASAMRATIDSSRAGAMQQGVGDAFGTFKKFYEDSKSAAVRRRADYNSIGLYQTPGFNYGGQG
jgi:hypothetical protein